MQLVQFICPSIGRRVGVIDKDKVIDLTSLEGTCRTVFDLAQRAFARQQRLIDVVNELIASGHATRLSYPELLTAKPDGTGSHLIAPFDHPEPSRLLISGTGLTHLGSVASRDQMHGGTEAEVPQTDSARMFAMGVKGEGPADGQRGIAPEWFYKGNGSNLRGPNSLLEIPGFTQDGGEEPEVAGCYVIDPSGQPCRIGFVLGNEWSDHSTEKINYLYLASSKLRVCAIGPSLQVQDDFADIALRCTVHRDGQILYDSGELRSGERNMCHSLANMEDHHFKYPQHRQPGDAHLHYFGTSKLSFGTRTWTYQPGDEIRITAPGFSAPLVNRVILTAPETSSPIKVKPI